MPKPSLVEPFQIPAASPLHEAHLAIQAFVDEAAKSHRGIGFYYPACEPKLFSNGKKLLDASPELAHSYVMAALEQARHWDKMADRVRSQAKTEGERINAHCLPGWQDVCKMQQPTAEAMKALTRRKLPFADEDLRQIVEWINASEYFGSAWLPIGNVVKALERFAADHQPSPALAAAVMAFGKNLRASHDNSVKRYGTVIEQLWYANANSADADEDEGPYAATPVAAMAGSPHVLRELKRRRGMADHLPETAARNIGPDEFPLADDSPLADEHATITQYLEEVIQTSNYYRANPGDFKCGGALLTPSVSKAASTYLAAAERQINAVLAGNYNTDDPEVWKSRYAAMSLTSMLDYQNVPWSREEAFDAILFCSTQDQGARNAVNQVALQLVDFAERYASENSLSEGERYALSLLRASFVSGPALGVAAAEPVRLTAIIGDGACFFLAPGEAWADAANDDLGRLPKTDRQKWTDLLSHLLSATSSRPSAKWVKSADSLVQAVGEATFIEKLHRWLPLVSKGRTISRMALYAGDSRVAADTMHDENATILRGVLWVAPTLSGGKSLTRLVTDVALSAYKKTPGVGPRAVKVGNAAVYALSELGSIDSVGQLAILKVRVKFGTAQKEIEKAFTKSAEALGLPRDDIEEMGAPSYGLTEVGQLTEPLGDCVGQITVTGSDATLTWRDKNGKSLKSVPARVSKDYAEDLKELKQTLKDVKAMLPAQRDRIDALFVAEKTWCYNAWKERYVDHPLIGTIARRLIWRIDGEPACLIDGEPRAVDGSAMEHGTTAEVSLWHPVGRAVAEVLRWRERLADLEITQPFKQAHREIYLLTAAEENTRTYSNRFAAHVIRQHQFNALCSARGWKNQLRLMVDADYSPPTKYLAQWNLRAEFWVEGLGDGYGTDTNDAGSYLYLATDQVRFYRTDAAENRGHASGGGYAAVAAGPGRENMNEPLPLADIPPLAFSEIMRDVDLFVGVASVGNDPTWQDGGPTGRYQEYWSSYSFGELSASAATRKEVLERLIPRLKIKDRCSFSERFLVVKGSRRNYKIHLGSGNILMEPNDEYLCIVPDARSKENAGDVYLPFEGDRTLSIILSKAILLAADDKIKDPTILRQIAK